MKMIFWRVLENGKEIDKVPYTEDCSADYVKRSLIDHDGYPDNIEVIKDNYSQPGEEKRLKQEAEEDHAEIMELKKERNRLKIGLDTRDRELEEAKERYMILKKHLDRCEIALSQATVKSHLTTAEKAEEAAEIIHRQKVMLKTANTENDIIRKNAVEMLVDICYLLECSEDFKELKRPEKLYRIIADRISDIEQSRRENVGALAEARKELAERAEAHETAERMREETRAANRGILSQLTDVQQSCQRLQEAALAAREGEKTAKDKARELQNDLDKANDILNEEYNKRMGE